MALLITTILWGSSFFILKNAIDAFPTFFVLAIRFTLSAALIGLIFIKRVIKINRKALLHGAVLGLVVACAYSLQTIGLKHTTPSKNAFLTAFYVVIVPFLAWLMLKRKPRVKNIIAAVLCIAGIGLVSINENFSVGKGDVLTLMCGIFYALQIIFITKYTAEDDFIQLLFMELSVIAVICWIVTAAYEPFPEKITFTEFLPILYLAIMCTGVTQLLQIFGQKYTPPNSAAIIISLESVFGTAFSIIFYHEILSLQTGIGFAIIFIAVLIGEVDWRPAIEKIKRKIKGGKEKQLGEADEGSEGKASDSDSGECGATDGGEETDI